jgi:hypothetical protein
MMAREKGDGVEAPEDGAMLVKIEEGFLTSRTPFEMTGHRAVAGNWRTKPSTLGSGLPPFGA